MIIDHIGIATRDLAEALEVWQGSLGLPPEKIEEVTDQMVRVAMLPVGESHVELLEATAPESPVARFIEKRGPGIHHIALRVPDIRAAIENLRQRGTRLIDDEPRIGAGGCLVAFIHPAATNGVLVELVQRQ
jgi:methylmalonyl-CoA/ethylmalonyl-CoA epimerase